MLLRLPDVILFLSYAIRLNSSQREYFILYAFLSLRIAKCRNRNTLIQTEYFKLNTP